MDYSQGIVRRRRVIPASQSFFAAAAAAATPMSLVLTAASSQYLTRTWGSTPTGLGKTATVSFFIKRLSVQSAYAYIYDGGDWNSTGTSESIIRFSTGDTLESEIYDGTSLLADVITNSDGTITDTTNWQHVCISYDSTQGTAANRLHIYVNGVEVSGYPTFSYITPVNASYHLSDSGFLSAIGRYQAGASRYLDAKLAYFYFVDGQQLTPSSFTTGTGLGTTHPATYIGSFGTNGFFLDFRSSATLDQSGNGNNWTQNNAPTFSVDLPT